jgi:hypothetical protein
MRTFLIWVFLAFSMSQAAAQDSRTEPANAPGLQMQMTPLPESMVPSPLRLPLEVDMVAAEQFVRVGFGRHLPGGKNFQSTQFLTPLLSTKQASHLIAMVPEYGAFRGRAVAEGVLRFAGRVSGVQFGREDHPVVYVDLPYWTNQREGTVEAGKGSRISDAEYQALVDELKATFVSKLSAQEFSAERRRVRIWWH